METEIEKKLDEIISILRSSNTFGTRSLLKSFAHGLATALGATFGFAIFIGVLGFLLRIFGAFPYIGSWFIDVGSKLHK
jgi:hypothetical protein